jgi:hypothetical protein
LKGLAGLFLVLGILLVLGGAGAAAYGYMDQQDHEEEQGPFGIGEDPDRTEQNEMLTIAGAVGAGAGVLLILVAVFFFMGGGARRDRAMREAMQGGSAPLDRIDGNDDAARRPSRRVLVPVALVAGAMFVVVLVAALSMDGGFSAANLGQSNAKPTEEVRSGTVGPSITVLGGSRSFQSSQIEFQAPAKGKAVEVVLNWTYAQGGAQQFEAYLEVEASTGWRQLDQQSGGPGLRLAYSGDDLAGANLRLLVFPATDGLVAEQDYEALLRFWR